LPRTAQAKDGVSLIENGLARTSVERITQPAGAVQRQGFAQLAGSLQDQGSLLGIPAASRQQHREEHPAVESDRISPLL